MATTSTTSTASTASTTSTTQEYQVSRPSRKAIAGVASALIAAAAPTADLSETVRAPAFVASDNSVGIEGLAVHDRDGATSEGIFVDTGSSTAVLAGDTVRVTGRVEEYRPGNDSDNLTTTELTDVEVVVTAAGGPVPGPELVGPGGRIPPPRVIDDDANGNVESGGTFDATTDGIDFWESLEGMRVGLTDAQVVGPRSRFGELPVVPTGSGRRTARGGVMVAAGDFNPERIVLDDVLAATPSADTGDALAGQSDGVLDHSFSSFKLLVTESPSVVSGVLPRERTASTGAGSCRSRRTTSRTSTPPTLRRSSTRWPRRSWAAWLRPTSWASRRSRTTTALRTPVRRART